MQLVATSNPSPGPAYFDARTSMDRLKLTSTRVLGHGGGSSSGSSDDATEDVDNQAFANRQRRHILVTGGFGSLGKAVVRDLLLNGGGAPPRTAAAWAAAGAPVDEQAWEEDVLVTILDVADRASELNFLLQSAPLDKPGAGGKGKGTDPRAKAFQASERSVDSFRKQGKLRVVVGDVRDAELVGQLLDPKGSYVTHLPGQIQAAALGDAQLGNLKQKGHATTTSFIPPVTGIIHLAAYSPEQCRRNPVDCRDVEEAGMKALLGSIEREGVDKEADLEGDKVVVADRPWVVLPRRADRWDDWRAPERAAGQRCWGLMGTLRCLSAVGSLSRWGPPPRRRTRGSEPTRESLERTLDSPCFLLLSCVFLRSPLTPRDGQAYSRLAS